MKKRFLILSLILIAGTAFADQRIVNGPTTSTSGNVPTYSDTTGKQIGTGLGVVTTVGATGSDSNVPTEQAVREAVAAVGGGHDAVTLDANADTVLSLTTQAIGLDAQTANTVFAGPVSGVAAVPAFRALGTTDIPDLSGTYVTGTPWTSMGYLTAEVDGSTTNEINTITGDNATTTSGLALTISGAGTVSTAVAGDTLTITGTGDGTGTDDQNATEVPVTTTNFGGIFANDATSNTVQKTLDLVDDHTHTGSSISGIDISDDTNLAGTANEIILTGDTLSLHSSVTAVTTMDDGGVVSLLGSAGTNTPTYYALDTDIVTGVSATDNTVASAKAIDTALDAKLEAETNSLETTITGIADTEIFVGSGANAGAFVVMSGDATLANTGALTIGNDKIDSQHYVAASIDNEHLADDAVDSAEIADGAVDAIHISDWYAYDTLPIAWAATGASGPDALNDRVTRPPYQYRTFAHDADEDVNYVWFVPSDLSGTVVQFRVAYLITNATGPSASEGVAFGLSGVSLGDNDATNGAKGTVVVVTDDEVNAAQHDVLITAWSGDVTITNLAAGEIAELALIRDVSDAVDDYAQVVGVIAIEIRYVKNVAR